LRHSCRDLGGLGNLFAGLVSAFLLAAIETYGVALTSPNLRSVLLYGTFVLACCFSAGPARATGRAMKRSTAALLAAVPLMAALPKLGSDYATGSRFNVAMWIALVESWSDLECAHRLHLARARCVLRLGAYIVVLGWDHLPLYATIPLAGASRRSSPSDRRTRAARARPVFRRAHVRHLRAAQILLLAYETASGVASRILFNAPQLDTIYYALLALAVAAALLMTGGGAVALRPRSARHS
jgi:hypothetical protein